MIEWIVGAAIVAVGGAVIKILKDETTLSTKIAISL